MADSNVNKVPTVAKVFGWISMALSCLGLLGTVLVIISALMPSYQGTSVQIQSEDAAKVAVFFLGCVIGYGVSPLGFISGIVSLIIMLTKPNKKMIWLPITGTALGLAGIFGVLLAIVVFVGSVS